MYQKSMTHEEIWKYLIELVPYLTKEEIETFSNLFNLMQNDYTPVQDFGNSNIQFVMEKEVHPYIEEGIPFPIPNDSSDDVKDMLVKFNLAKSHMEANELMCIANVLSMVDEYEFTVKLMEEEDRLILKLHNPEIVNTPKTF